MNYHEQWAQEQARKYEAIQSFAKPSRCRRARLPWYVRLYHFLGQEVF